MRKAQSLYKSAEDEYSQKRRIPMGTKRRGQISGFAILGVVVLALVVLLFFLRDQLGIVLPGPLGGKPADIGEHIRQCLHETAPELIERMGKQGGFLSTPDGTFKLYQDIPISYLCYNIDGEETCRNRMLTLIDMQQELGDAIDKGLTTCIDYGAFRKRGYDLTIGQRNIVVDVGRDATLVTVKQPLKMTRGDTVVNFDEVAESFSYPLGRLYDVGQDVVDTETTAGEFDQLPYMLAHRGQYLIEKKRPYPDKLYILQTKDHPFIFQFFVQGEPS